MFWKMLFPKSPKLIVQGPTDLLDKELGEVLHHALQPRRLDERRLGGVGVPDSFGVGVGVDFEFGVGLDC